MAAPRRLTRTAVGVALMLTLAAPVVPSSVAAAAHATSDSHVTRLSTTPAHAVRHRRVDARAVAARQGAAERTGPRASGQASTPTAAAPTPATAAITAPTVATFSTVPGVSSVGFGGADVGSLPCGSVPCTQAAHSSLAVGPYDVVQATSVGFRMTDRAGTAPFDLTYGDFAGLDPALAGGVDGRVLYDRGHDRWVAAFAEWDCDGSTNVGFVDIAISSSTDPQWFWDVWSYPFDGFVPVMPSIGTSSNKIVVGAGRSALPATGEPCFSFASNTSSAEASVYAIDWATALSPPSSLPASHSPWLAGSPWVLAPTEGGSATAAVYGVNTTPDPSGVTQLLTVTGTVGTSTISPAITDLTAGGIVDLDAPPTGVVRDAGNLAIASDTTCTPAGASTPFGCVRLTRIAASGTTLIEDLAIGRDGFNDVAPAIGRADDGGVHLVYDESPEGPTAFAGVSSWTVHRAAGAPAGQVSKPALVALGPDTYTGGHGPGGMTGLASDPSDPHAVWQAAEYAGDPDGAGGWTTWISKLTTGVAASPAGTVTIEAGRPSTHALAIHLDAEATSGTQLRVSSSAATSGGKLTSAAVMQPTMDARWDLSDATFGGSSATGSRHVYVQFGDGAGAWSPVVDRAITYAGPPPVIRRSGASRYDTAAAVAKAEYRTNAPIVYIATGLNFPDALAGAGAAGHTGGPILLVTPSLPIPSATASALTFLHPTKIVVLGGTGAVSDAVKGALAGYSSLGAAGVTRLAGSSRYATAAAISAATYQPGVEEVLIATGLNFPDALAGAAVAGKLGDPLLLVTSTAIPAATATELTRLKPHRITILGGSGAVSSSVSGALSLYTDGGIFRVAGSSRYDTAARIAETWFSPQPTLALVATGLNFPDALAGAALAGRLSSPILLVAPTSIPAPTGNALGYLAPPEIDVLGGTGAVSSGVATQLGAYVVP